MAPVRAYAPNLRLQEHRTRLDLTQEAVAEELARLAWVHYGMRVGVNADMVGKWERGEKRPSKLYRRLLCLLYQATEEELGLRGPISDVNREMISPAVIGRRASTAARTSSRALITPINRCASPT